MWKFTSNVIASIGLKKSLAEHSQACLECSDDEASSNISREEGLECPICWESFNIVENVPYVLWCGHTLCQNCVLGLQPALLSFSSQQIKIPFLISCPWCHLYSFRFIHGGQLRFPRKNYFVLWMVESLHGDEVKSLSSSQDNQQISSLRFGILLGNHPSNSSPRRRLHMQNSAQPGDDIVHLGSAVDGRQFSISKSLDLFIDCMSKFPLVIIFLLTLFFLIPSCAVILVIYFLLTVLFAIPSFLVLYFAYPILGWLVKEITSM